MTGEYKTFCPKCRSKGGDRSGDNLHVYGEGRGSFCFSCGYATLSEEERDKRGIDKYEWTDANEEEVLTKEMLSKEEVGKIKSYTNTDGKNSREITNSTYAKYFVRFEYDESTGAVTKHYYPITQGYLAAGYKIRTLPKDFSSVGKVGKQSDLFGQWAFKNASGKFVVIASGEIDAMSAYQMLEEYNQSRGGSYEPVPVVSSVIGESGSHKQLQLQYDWLNRFDKIIVIPDQDAAGLEAVENIAKVLPRNKLYIMSLPEKDTNVMLVKGKQRQFISCFYEAKQYTPAGIVNSSEIYKEILERAHVDKLPFPPMMKGVNDVLAGGVNYGYICNILAGSGSGKSSCINQCITYWMNELDLNVAVVSLEAEAGEFGENLLSQYMGKKIALMKNKEERIAFVSSQEAKDAAYSLFNRDDGSSRLFLLDDRGDYSKLQDKIEEMIVSCDCKIIVVDVVSDVFAGKSIEEVDKWMAWCKKIVKQYNCIMFNISHTRKSGSGEKTASQGSFLTEESIIGSGTQYRSAGVNIALQRDKNNEDPMIRNTTQVHVLKSRSTGWTGKACEMYYDSASHTLFDRDEWVELNGVREF